MHFPSGVAGTYCRKCCTVCALPILDRSGAITVSKIEGVTSENIKEHCKI
jgi:hypothetical protein